MLLEARRDIARPTFTIHARDGEGTVIFGLTREMAGDLTAGTQVRLTGTIENSLVPGPYTLDCWVRGESDDGDFAVQGLRLLEFAVEGAAAPFGLVSVQNDIEVVREP